MINKRNILFYDIETTPIQAWIWRCGKQVVRPAQLTDTHNKYNIICIGYAWERGSNGVLTWDQKKKDSYKIVETFSDMCEEADIVIGKNNKRFDDKHLNTMRMLHNMVGRPELLKHVDDLESQIRRHFFLPSYGLDYISKILGKGGKDPMEFQDWIDIVEDTPNAQKALKKMAKYCLKDVKDTKDIWKYCEKHLSPKLNSGILQQDEIYLRCSTCGSENISKNGTRLSGQTLYQHYFCKAHGGYAGRKTVNSKKPILRS